MPPYEIDYTKDGYSSTACLQAYDADLALRLAFDSGQIPPGAKVTAIRKREVTQ